MMNRLFGRLLPDDSDVLGLLIAQAEVTVEGMDALVSWAEGQAGADRAVRDAEHAADERKHALVTALRQAFVTPLAAEDIVFMSTKLDAILGGAKDTVRMAEALGVAPDASCHAMAVMLAAGVADLRTAFTALRAGRRSFEEATKAADAAHKGARQVERIYREALVTLLGQEDLRAVIARHEIYRQLESLNAEITRVADRVPYVVVKES